MRDLTYLAANKMKDRRLPEDYGDKHNGAFVIPSKIDGQALRVICSAGYGWDHVSVSRTNRCPNWPEMEQIRRMFFNDDEAVMQYHAPVADYVDGSRKGDHPYCLHLWRPTRGPEIPTPPKWMVGGMTPAEAEEASKKEIP